MSEIINLNGIEVRVRQSLKARNTSIKIKYDGVELVIPRRGSLKRAKEFLFSKEKWVRGRLKKHTHEKIDESFLPILGKEYPLDHIEDITQAKARIEGDKIIVISASNRKKQVISEFLKKHIRKEIERLCQEIAEEFGFKYNKIRITDTKTRWGSCSSRGVLSFSWRIIFAPRSVFNYLVVHEMAHLKVMSHSKKFWDLVETIYPGYEIHKKWLKVNGRLLHKYL